MNPFSCSTIFWRHVAEYELLRVPYCYWKGLSSKSRTYGPKIGENYMKYVSKSLQKIVLIEKVFISNFCEVEMFEKSPKISNFMQLQPILGSYDPLKSPLHYQQSTLKGSYSPKIQHKVLIPEYGFISIYFEVKCSKGDQNDIFCAILANFGTICPTTT